MHLCSDREVHEAVALVLHVVALQLSGRGPAVGEVDVLEQNKT